MRQWEVVALALVVFLASAPAMALPQPPPGPYTPRPPISISGDANFTAENGVVAGNGTPEDPYVISGHAFVTSGVAVRVHNVTSAFIIANNSFDAQVGVHISESTGVGLVYNNQFLVRATGVVVANADAIVVDNSFIGTTASGGLARGVELYNSNSRVESNAFLFVQFAVRAERGSPSVLCNDMHDDVIVAGVSLKYTTNATVSCNIITRCNTAIASVSAIGTIIANNTITNCVAGVIVHLTKDVTVANNTIRLSTSTQLTLDTTSGNVTGNVIIDGRVDAAVVFRSPVLFANNTIENNLGVGIRFSETTADVEANVVSRNAVGIKLEGGSVPHLTANVVSNNSVGIDLPYASRQVIVNMSANVINGVNVDGAINASQKIFFYKESNVTISTVVDGGFSAGFFGSISAQGGIILYEVNTVNMNGTVVAHQNVGVRVVNSFNVNINGSALISNHIGVVAEVAASAGQVPNCVVSIKDTNITIPVDPIASIGIDVKGCLAIVARVNVSVVDTGIRVNAQAGLLLSNSTITETKLALDVAGAAKMVNLSGNLVYGNWAGARLSGTQGLVANNTFLDNDHYGIRLENAARIDLRDNQFLANGVGLIDAEPCLGILSCSSVDARNNSFLGNAKQGALVHGVSSWRGDLAADNAGDGFELYSTATLRDVVSRNNGGDGARITGNFDIEDSIFTANGDDGIELHGGGAIEASDFTHNEAAGLRISPTFVAARHINVSDNFDGIFASASGASGTGAPTSLPALLGLLGGAGTGAPAPFDVHLSILSGNERDAVRAGSALVNATHNYWGKASGPSISFADQVGAFQNGISPSVRFVPYFTDEDMTTTGPVAGL